MTGYIYKAEVAKKFYIGKTIHSFESRVKTHINLAFKHHATMRISEALRTLNETDAYNVFSIVETIEEKDYDSLEARLCDRENYWMDYYNSIYPNGYNVSRSAPSKRRVVKTQPPRESVMREVICVETGEHFKSMSAASKSVGVDISAVYHCLKGINNTAGGKHWRYADGEYHECTRPEGRRNKASQSKPVMCKETGIIYPSFGEAERQTGVCWTSIARCVRGQMISAGGLHWGAIKDGKPIFLNVIDKNKAKVKCVETGEIFESIAECARKIGDRNSGSLQSSIKRGCKHKGMTYVKIDECGNPVPRPKKLGKV